MKQHWFIFLISLCIFSACKDESFPKPKAYLKLTYPEVIYNKIKTDCSYEFEISNQAQFKQLDDCWARIKYPKQKATIHLTYRKIENLEKALTDVEKLTYKHTVKADAINVQPFENRLEKTFGNLYLVEGNSASNIQFHVTDSTNHILSGTLYLYAMPNYDSILPAVKYLEKDIKHLIETIRWKN